MCARKSAPTHESMIDFNKVPFSGREQEPLLDRIANERDGWTLRNIDWPSKDLQRVDLIVASIAATQGAFQILALADPDPSPLPAHRHVTCFSVYRSSMDILC